MSDQGATTAARVMRAKISTLSLFLSAMLTGCATPPQPPLMAQQGPFGAEQNFTGILALGFERQSFNNCWLDLFGTAQTDLARLAPSPALADQRAPYAAEVTLVGRRRDMLNVEGQDVGGQGFGHLGMYPCLIEATRITAARIR
jgi:hypothetical protein